MVLFVIFILANIYKNNIHTKKNPCFLRELVLQSPRFQRLAAFGLSLRLIVHRCKEIEACELLELVDRHCAFLHVFV